MRACERSLGIARYACVSWTDPEGCKKIPRDVDMWEAGSLRIAKEVASPGIESGDLWKAEDLESYTSAGKTHGFMTKLCIPQDVCWI